MEGEKNSIQPKKSIAIVAHDHRKADMIQWVTENKPKLRPHRLFATGSTGELIGTQTGLAVTRFHSGPLGGDQEIGAAIANGRINVLIFFIDPLYSHPHDDDIKALLRLATLYNVPVALNAATADFLISSPFFNSSYNRQNGQ